MNIQEAYNKGLDDSEKNVITIFTKALIGEETGEFNNPEMNKVLEVLKIRSDYYRELASRGNNIGKSFTKRLINEEHGILGIQSELPKRS